MIEVTHLVKRYGKKAAVDDLSFTVEKGQIYGFLGPNGAGKSTTMNIMTGYIAPTSGEVRVNGHNILEEPEAARKCIGYLPEIPPVYPEMTVLEYLIFAAELKKLPRKSRASMIAQAMELTGITEVQLRLIRNLSKGYRQRVGLAQAILGFPEIIILDEPMVGLDPKQIIEIRDLIRNLAKKHTVILSSHILSEISAICDHIMIIAHGKLVASDTPQNLTKLMQSSGVLELTIKTAPDQARSLFTGLKGVISAEVKKSEEANCSDVILQMEAAQEKYTQEAQEQEKYEQEAQEQKKRKQDDSGSDIREEIFYLCARKNIPILRMQQSRVSLEDIFLELTEEHTEMQEADKVMRTDKFAREDIRKTAEMQEADTAIQTDALAEEAGEMQGGEEV